MVGRRNTDVVTASRQPDPRDRIERLTVVAPCPDGSLRARVDAKGQFGIEILPSCLDIHTEESFAAQLSTAVGRALRTMDDAVRRITTESQDDAPRRPRPAAVQARLDRFAAAVATIEVTGDSPWGYVRATWRGSTEIAFRLRRRTLRLVNTTLLAAETIAALDAAQRSRTAQYAQAHQESFRSPRTER